VNYPFKCKVQLKKVQRHNYNYFTLQHFKYEYIHCHYKARKRQGVADRTLVKEECHIHLGWLEGE